MIYLVLLGYDWEGSTVQDVFNTLASAEIFIQEFIKEDSKNFEWAEPWVKNEKHNSWRSGGRYLAVKEMQVKN